MIKKLLLTAMLVLGLVYGSGHDLSSIKNLVTDASDENARGVMASSSDGWGPRSGY